jgi:hypothetical protein
MKRLFLIVSLCLSGVGMVFAQNDAQTVAMVNLIRQEPITVRQLRTALAPLEQAAGRVLQVSERRQALDQLVGQRLIIQAAERDKMTVSPVEVDNALKNNLVSQLGRQPTDQEFAQALQQAGANAATLREEARKQLLMQKYVMTKKQAQIQAVNQYEPTEADITYSYLLYRRELIRLDTLGVTLISIPIGSDRAKAKATADSLTREIGTSSAKFDEIALRGQSNDSLEKVGYAARVAYLERSAELDQQSGKQFVTTIFNLKQGEVSPQLETRDAFFFVKVNSVYEFKVLELNDPVSPANPRMTVREYVRQDLKGKEEQRVLEQALQELIADLKRERNAVTVFDQYLNW